jgi:hypothetical protein
MNSKLKPALIGGVVVGLLSAIPFVNLLNFCCCLWALLGGALAANIFIKNSPTPAGPGDGAVVGLLAGVVGALIYIVIGIPLGILTSGVMVSLMSGLIQNMDPSQAEAIRQQMASTQNIAGAIINGLIMAVLLVVFSTIGGLLGIPIFEKRKAAIPPPPPSM